MFQDRTTSYLYNRNKFFAFSKILQILENILTFYDLFYESGRSPQKIKKKDWDPLYINLHILILLYLLYSYPTIFIYTILYGSTGCRTRDGF